MKKVIFFFFIAHCQSLFSQCCPGCSPIGGNTNLGTLPEHTMQVNSYIKYSYSEGYQQEDHASDFKFIKNANNNYTGLQLAYGLHKRFTLETEIGYYLNRTQNIELGNGAFKYTYTGQGLSSVNVLGRLNIYKDTAARTEFTVGAGARIPCSFTPQVKDGVELPQDVQPSNGAYGFVFRSYLYKELKEKNFRVFLISTINLNGKNSKIVNGQNQKSFQEGNTYLNALFISKTFSKLTTMLQLRNEIRQHSYDYEQLVPKSPNSGGFRFVLSPQVSYSLSKNWMASVFYELPIYQYYNGLQLKDKYSCAINLTYRFEIGHNHSDCKAPH